MKKQRWVVKAGSNLLIQGGPLLIRDLMLQVEALKKNHQIEIIWVTSGAIGTARKRLGIQKKKKASLSEKQALSAIGQPMVMDLYNLALQSCGLKGAQVLITYSDLANKTQLKNFQNTLETLLAWNVVPILNENDAVATEEIRFGDNDSLSAKIAIALKADRLVILTDVAGVYDSDPSKNPGAQLIHEIPKITEKVLKIAGKSKSEYGTGGMLSKLLAAQEASRHRVTSHLVKGDHASVLLKIAKNEQIGTLVKKQK